MTASAAATSRCHCEICPDRSEGGARGPSRLLSCAESWRRPSSQSFDLVHRATCWTQGYVLGAKWLWNPIHACGKPDLHGSTRQVTEHISQAPGGHRQAVTARCDSKFQPLVAHILSDLPPPLSSMLGGMLESGLRKFARSNLPPFVPEVWCVIPTLKLGGARGRWVGA